MRHRFLAAVAVSLVAAGCDRLPGRPRSGDRPLRPSEVRDAATLYARSCAGCHGADGRPGAAVALADPVYLALADDETIRRVTALGVPGTAMPAFARSAGGTLTDEQIEALVHGIRTRWARPAVLEGMTLPPYAAPPGDAQRGARAYASHCASCHGPSGAGGERGGSIVDGSYLALVSDQALRTTVLVGRPTFGMPDWRGDGKGRPMTADEIADVVAWLVAQRPQLAGRPRATDGGHDG